MKDNQDLLDLCRLNLMEENVKESAVAPDKDVTLYAIDYHRRLLVTRLKNDPSPIADNAMEKHAEANSIFYE